MNNQSNKIQQEKIIKLVKARSKVLKEIKQLDEYKIKIRNVRQKYGKRT